jgi:hypothetical protein
VLLLARHREIWDANLLAQIRGLAAFGRKTAHFVVTPDAALRARHDFRTIDDLKNPLIFEPAVAFGHRRR